MVPADYKDFLVAVVTSAASFIGLLFVAMSFITDEAGKIKKEKIRENMLAQGSYMALVDLFFVSLLSLIPDTEIGHALFILGILGLLISYRLVKAGIRSGASWGTFGLSTIAYMSQVVYGVHVIYNSHKVINSTFFVTMIIVLFASALGRAWELTGINQR